jgi:2,3-bisphosphoglycerate-independent phosphoglycerate mutase
MNNKVILMILDGWGIAKNSKVSAIDNAKTPFIKSLYQKYPHSTLEASGLAVGLPEGQMGNSEVGHTNIGAGRVVYQDLVRINKACKSDELAKNPILQNIFQYIQKAEGKSGKQPKKLHFIGLLSDGGVHSHIEHLKALCKIADEQKIENVFVHAFTDGRDTDPKSGVNFIKDLENSLKNTKIKIASVIGRYYAMDRDKRWERLKLAYDLLTKGIGNPTQNLVNEIEKSYNQEVTDEFIKPIIAVDTQNKPLGIIEEGDAVLCFNFRSDRGREITEVLTQQDFPEFGMQKISLKYATLTNYDTTFENVQVLFDKENLKNTLGEVLANHGKTQIRIAETEKYPHVTFFFSGGREEPFKGEKRLLCPSAKVATYDLKPEMSAEAIAQTIIPEIQKQETDFICLNFANADMVGHTGVWEAAIKACETVDKCTQEIVENAIKNNYTVVIIADHGNADVMINDDKSPNTAHSTNLVPCILVNEKLVKTVKLKNGILANVAPTILDLMGIETPPEMTEKSLLENV